MQQFVDLQSVYSHLEARAAEYIHLEDIGSLFQKARDHLHADNKTEDAKIAQWEIDFFNFVVDGPVLKPRWSGVNEKGEESGYPTLARFEDSTYT